MKLFLDQQIVWVRENKANSLGLAASQKARAASNINSPNITKRTFQDFMEQHMTKDAEIPLFTKSSGFHNANGKIGGQFKRFGLGSHVGIAPHVLNQ